MDTAIIAHGTFVFTRELFKKSLTGNVKLEITNDLLDGVQVKIKEKSGLHEFESKILCSLISLN
jgi:hypothetical protein